MIKVTVRESMLDKFQDNWRVRDALQWIYPDAFTQEVVIESVPDDGEVFVKAEKVDD